MNAQTLLTFTQEVDNFLEEKREDSEDLALLLIKEIECALVLKKQDEIYVKRSELIDKLIDNNSVPEEISQRLLHLKVLYFLNKKEYRKAENVLSVLDVEENRLVCNTTEYYRLLLLKAQVYIKENKYERACIYLQELKRDVFSSEEFQENSNKEELIKDWKVNAAIVAHFSFDDEAYDLFQELLNNKAYKLTLDSGSKQIYMVSGYESFRQKKYTEASNAFSQLYNFSKEPSKVNEGDFFREVTAMTIISKILSKNFNFQEEWTKFNEVFIEANLPLSASQEYLKKNVTELVSSVLINGEIGSSSEASFRTNMYGPLFNTLKVESSLVLETSVSEEKTNKISRSMELSS